MNCVIIANCSNTPLSGGYYLRVATIRGRLLFEGLLFEGGYYLRVAIIQGVATIRRWPLSEGGHYTRAATIRGATIRGRLLFEGGYYLRVATI